MMLLQLSLCFATVIQLTSSQSTHDVIGQENDVNSCGRTHDVLNQLVTTVSQLKRDVNDVTEQVLSRLVTAVSQLQTDVAKLKAFSLRNGMLKARCNFNSRNLGSPLRGVLGGF